jgi:hypothetical protein
MDALSEERKGREERHRMNVSKSSKIKKRGKKLLF